MNIHCVLDSTMLVNVVKRILKNFQTNILEYTIVKRHINNNNIIDDDYDDPAGTLKTERCINVDNFSGFLNFLFFFILKEHLERKERERKGQWSWLAHLSSLPSNAILRFLYFSPLALAVVNRC